MPDELFHDLAMKVLAGEASSDERASLESELLRNAERAREMDALREAFALTRATAHLQQALETAHAPELPAYRMGELRSAVRTHFRQTPKSTVSERLHEWVSRLTGRWVLASGAVAACLIIFLLAQPGPQGIEVGLYAEPLTRSQSTAPLVTASHNVSVNTFESDRAFDQWVSAPFGKNEKARLWLDDEHAVLHIRVRPRFLGSEREYTLPLPDSDRDRRTAIEHVLSQLR